MPLEPTTFPLISSCANYRTCLLDPKCPQVLVLPFSDIVKAPLGGRVVGAVDRESARKQLTAQRQVGFPSECIIRAGKIRKHIKFIAILLYKFYCRIREKKFRNVFFF